MQANQTPTQSMFTRINTRKTRRFFASSKAPSKAATTMQRKAAKAHTLALLFKKIIFG